MIFRDNFKLNPLVCCMGWGGGHDGRDGMGGDTGVAGDESGLGGNDSGGSGGSGNGDYSGGWEGVVNDKKNGHLGAEGYTVGTTGANTGEVSDDFGGARDNLDNVRSFGAGLKSAVKGGLFGPLGAGVSGMIGFGKDQQAQIEQNIKDMAMDDYGIDLSDEQAVGIREVMEREYRDSYQGRDNQTGGEADGDTDTNLTFSDQANAEIESIVTGNPLPYEFGGEYRYDPENPTLWEAYLNDGYDGYKQEFDEIYNTANEIGGEQSTLLSDNIADINDSISDLNTREWRSEDDLSFANRELYTNLYDSAEKYEDQTNTNLDWLTENLTQPKDEFKDNLAGSVDDLQNRLDSSFDSYETGRNNATGQANQDLAGLLEIFNADSDASLDTFRDTRNTLNNQYAERADTHRQESVGMLDAAESKQGNLLDGLISDLQTNNQITPMAFGINGSSMSFIPKAQRDTVNQIAGLGQQGYDNTSNTAKDRWTINDAADRGIADFGEQTATDIRNEEQETIGDKATYGKEITDTIRSNTTGNLDVLKTVADSNAGTLTDARNYRDTKGWDADESTATTIGAARQTATDNILANENSNEKTIRDSRFDRTKLLNNLAVDSANATGNLSTAAANMGQMNYKNQLDRLLNLNPNLRLFDIQRQDALEENNMIAADKGVALGRDKLSLFEDMNEPSWYDYIPVVSNAASTLDDLINVLGG